MPDASKNSLDSNLNLSGQEKRKHGDDFPLMNTKHPLD